MIQQYTFDFLADLRKNNVREWFKENRQAYDAAKSDFLQFVEALIEGLGEIDPQIKAANLIAKDCMLRINRDIRFSADKSPYKTNFFANLNQGGRKSPFASYYLHLEPGNSFGGGGVYMPESIHLKAFRSVIDENFTDWQSIVTDKGFKSTFPEGVQAPKQLSRPPKGYDKDNPAIEYLKMKGFYTMKGLEDKVLKQKNALDNILEIFATAKPMVEFLNRSLVTDQT